MKKQKANTSFLLTTDYWILCFFFLTPACHAVAQQSVGGTPETWSASGGTPDTIEWANRVPGLSCTR